MITFVYCDFDSFLSSDTNAITTHFTDNPTHTSRIGIMGDSGIPAHYGGGSTPQEVTTDPVSPTAGDIWVLHSASVTGGSPIGLLLSLTQTQVASQYLLSYRTTENTTVRTVLS